jgi:hypothetical protein
MLHMLRIGPEGGWRFRNIAFKRHKGPHCRVNERGKIVTIKQCETSEAFKREAGGSFVSFCASIDTASQPCAMEDNIGHVAVT